MSGGASSGRSSWRARRLAVPGLEWAYANHARAAVLFLGISSGMLVVGIVAVLVFVTRVATRGAVSFSIYSRRSIDEAEQAVLNALETEGKNAQVKRVRGRTKTPARIVSADGVAARFRIEVSRHAALAEPGEWTEIIEVFPKGERPEAQALRAKILEGLRSEGTIER